MNPPEIKPILKNFRKLNILAIGASAGGLEALQEFLSYLPSLENTAIIIAQHLSPTHKSMLVQLLSKGTTLSVTEAEHGKVPQPSTIYITPPDSEITITQTGIQLQKPEFAYGPKPSVDVLFRSLAEVECNHIVGIILSGTGSDGAAGVKSLKNSGAYIIAQEPATAKYDGMPLAAIETGMVDAVLSPIRIGEEILDYFNDSLSVKKAPDQDSLTAIGKIMGILGKNTGTDFSNYKSATIGRRLEKRMNHLQVKNLDEYIKVLETHPREADEMFKMILIGVTKFFRDKDAFQALEAHLEKIISAKSPQDAIRIWVPGCSTGEEAYSIAILLQKILKNRLNQYKIQIFATDIDNRAVTFARKGIYPSETVENLPDDILERYFVRNGEGYEIIKPIQSLVMFSRHDLIKNPPFLKLDLISCRNLLIYFNAALQQQVIPIFHYALNQDGNLFLGKSETVGQFNDLFTSIDPKNKIYRRKRGGNLHTIKFSAFKAQSQNFPAAKPKKENKELSISEMVKETLYKTYEHPYVVVNESFDIQEVGGDVRLFMGLSSGNIQVNLIKMINPELQIELRAVLNKAINDRIIVRSPIKKFTLFDQPYYVRLHVKPLISSNTMEELYLVIFEKLDIEGFLAKGQAVKEDDIINQRIEELESELAATKEHLQTYIEEIETSNEELQSLNEELQSTNEELQSSNEELETSNEELQSTNEEIQITYAELKSTYEELEKKEKNLQEAEANNIALLNNDLQAFVLVDPSYRIIRFNDQAKLIFEELSGKQIQSGESIVDYFPSGKVEEFISNFKQTLKGEKFQAEKIFLDKNGINNWFKASYTPVLFSEGKVRGISLSLLNITELKKQQTQLDAVTENLPLAIFQYKLNPEGKDKVLFLNEGSRKLWGLEAQAAMDDTSKIWSKVLEEDATGLSESIQASAKSLSNWNYEWRVEHPELGLRWHRGFGKPSKIEDDSVIWNTIVLDITTEKLSQLALGEREQDFKNLFDNVNNLSTKGFDKDGNIRFWNKASEKLYGFSEEEVLGKNIFDIIIPKEKRQVFEEAMRRLIKTKKSQPAEEFNYIHKNGEITPVLSNITIIENSVGEKEFFLFDIDISPQIKIKEALKKSEAELKKILDSSMDMIFTIDSQGNFIKVSKACEFLLGYSPEELEGKAFMNFVVEEDITKTEEAAEMIMKGNAYTNFENRYRRKNGESIPFIWSARWEDDIQMMFCVAKDAREIKKAEEKVRASEALMADAQKLAKMGSWNYDFENDDLTWTDALYNVYGVDKDKLDKKLTSFLHMVVPEDKEMYISTGQEAKEKGKPFHIEYGIITPSGERRILEEYGYCEKNRQGKVIRMYGTVQDVTERKKIEKKIQESNQRFKLATQATSDVIWDWNVKTGAVLWGENFASLFGEIEDLADMNQVQQVKHRLHPSEINDLLKSAEKALKSDQTNWRYEHRFLKADGKYIFVSNKALIIRDKKNKALRVIGAIQDITQRKDFENSLLQLNEQLENHAKELALSNAELEQFAYVASHDLQEPLRMVSSFLTQLEKRYEGILDEKGKQYIHYAVDGARRMRSIILDLLDFSRVGKHEDELSEIDLNEIVGEVSQLYRQTIEESKAQIKTHDLPKIKGYKTPILQLFQNLIGNGLKYRKNDTPPEINVKCVDRNNCWEIAIQDNGIGIESDFFEKIFVIFQRLHHNNQFSGTGMGLAIVKKIVDNLGGKVWLESIPGLGSTFYFTLPKSM
jgi:two-component system CheB/CheR fusion protein